MLRSLVTWSLLAFGGSCLQAQQQPAAKPSFEVATVKAADPGERNFALFFQPGGRLRATGVSLKYLTSVAYGVRDFQISGGPSWISSDRWNIEAKAEDGTVPPGRIMPGSPFSLMFQ